MRFSFLPTEVKFFDYFQAATRNLIEAAQVLQALFEDFHDVDARVKQIIDLEHKGDLIVHDVTNLLVRTLVTPFSSDEIEHLIQAVDTTLDTIHLVAVRVSIYQITEPRPIAQRLAHLILEGSTELDQAMQHLEDKGRYPQVKERVVNIHTIENAADDALETGLRELVAQYREGANGFDFIRWKEVYERLEECTDRLADASDAMQRVMIANA